MDPTQLKLAGGRTRIRQARRPESVRLQAYGFFLSGAVRLINRLHLRQDRIRVETTGGARHSGR